MQFERVSAISRVYRLQRAMHLPASFHNERNNIYNRQTWICSNHEIKLDVYDDYHLLN